MFPRSSYLTFSKIFKNEEKNIELPDYDFTSTEVEMLSNLRCNDSINSPITCDEIQKCIKDLKRNKACGDDIYN